MNERVRSSWDLVGIVLLSFILALSIFLIPDSSLRIYIGLPFLLFFPGYELTAFIFREKKSLDAIERMALSIGLSIAVTPLIGFILSYTPFGISLETILVSMTAFNIGFGLFAYWRRYQVEDPYLPFNPKVGLDGLMKVYRSKGRVDRLLTTILAIAIASSLIALVYVVAIPKQGESFTDFYILGPGRIASEYPHDLDVGESAFVYVGIADHEHRKVHYFVQTWLINATFSNNQTSINRMYYLEMFDVVLDHVPAEYDKPWTTQWEYSYSFSIPIEGQYKMWFFLFLDEVPGFASNLTYMQDYANTDCAELVQQAVDNQLASLNIYLSISPTT